MTSADRVVRLGLIGSGTSLTTALETLRVCPSIAIAVVADVSGQHSQAARLAIGLGIPVVTTATDVFRANADIILELSGDNRQYERLLAVKPPGVEVMSARGARLLLDLFKQSDGQLADTSQAPRVLVIVPAHQSQLYAYLKEGFAGVRDVEVIVDNRRRERRQRLRAQASERRLAQRRSQPRLDEEFRTRGFAIRRRQP